MNIDFDPIDLSPPEFPTEPPKPSALPRVLLTPQEEATLNLAAAQAGVPPLNNRTALKSWEQNFPGIIPPELTPLLKLLDEARPLPPDTPLHECRAKTRALLQWLSKNLPVVEVNGEKIHGVRLFADHFDHPTVLQFVKLLSFLPSVATLFWVHFALWGVSIYKLGSDEQRAALLDKTDSLEVIGCLMMTEVGHGSNIQGLETTATFDPETDEFVLDTPNVTSQKCWIGGSAQNATHGVVFAKLLLAGKSYGVHPFIVDIRNKPGIEIWDLGKKRGLQGVDNGIVSFKGVRIPRTNMLMRFCEVDRAGNWIYKSGSKSPQNQVYNQMIQFIFGRKVIALSSQIGMGMLSTLYCCYPPPSIGYDMHGKYTADLLGKAFLLLSAEPLYTGPKNGDDHFRASMMKAISSDMMKEELLFARDQYRSPASVAIFSLLTSFIDDQDATVTYEGDNILLWQLYCLRVFELAQKFFEGFKYAPHVSLVKFLNWAWNRQEPRFILLASAFSGARTIGSALLKVPANGRRNAFSMHYQIQGIQTAKQHTAYLLLTKFEDFCARQEHPAFKSLYNITAWSFVRKFAPVPNVPDLSNDYAIVAAHLFELTARLGFKVEWMDKILTPPKFSRPFALEEIDLASKL